MKLKTKERLAFGIEQAFMLAGAIASIWFASRIGYQEAIKFTRYQEVRRVRDLLRSMDHELAINERAVRRGLEDWTSDEFRGLHVVSRSFRRGKEGDDLFFLNYDTVRVMSDAYGELFQKALNQIREQGGGPIFRPNAVILTYQLDLLEDARPKLQDDIGRVEQEMHKLGGRDVSKPKQWPPDPVPEPDAEESAALKLPASTIWGRGAGARYAGLLQDFAWVHLAVAARPRGPVLISFRLNLSAESMPVRVWLCFRRKSPIDLTQILHAKIDEEELRAIFTGEEDANSFVMSYPLDAASVRPAGRDSVEVSGDIVDPNRLAGWRWLYVLLEDAAGQRHVVRGVTTWKIGPDDPWKFSAKVPDGALVLPVGYAAGPVRYSAPSPKDLVEAGRNHLANGRFRDAVYAFGAALKLDPKIAEAWKLLGDAQMGTEEPVAALASYTKAVDLGLDSAETFLARGEAHYVVARSKAWSRKESDPAYQKAVEDFTRALEKDGKMARAWFLRGMARAGMEDWTRAVSDVKRAVDLDAARAEEYATRVRWFERFQEDAALAQEAREKGPKLDQQEKELFDQSMAAYNAKEWATAIRGFKILFYLNQFNPTGRSSAYNLACCYALSGEKDRALDWMEIMVDHGYSDWDHMKKDTDFDALRSDPRYKRLMTGK
ncbi:MAG: tetratricopeptide repeat protein [Planctomycetes bacterium]|nr:tetratricopeptide repeat protein [Planctomycetota bacterium]